MNAPDTMRKLFHVPVLLLLIVVLPHAGVFPPAAIPAVLVQAADADEPTDAELAQELIDRQLVAMRIHKTMAFTTAGLLLLSDAIGAYHFYDLATRGHQFRDSIGFTEESPASPLQNNWIKSEWGSSSSQALRVLHGALIAASSVCYTATATIELSMPRMSKNPLAYSNTRIHRNLFILHATLMAANIGLGFAESKALSAGNHNLVQGLGITHMVIGFSAPVVMCVSGLAFKLPWY